MPSTTGLLAKSRERGIKDASTAPSASLKAVGYALLVFAEPPFDAEAELVAADLADVDLTISPR